MLLKGLKVEGVWGLHSIGTEGTRHHLDDWWTGEETG
jgi:hypothetical protein